MKKKVLGLIGLSAASLLSANNLSTGDVAVVGEIRERFETLDGMNKKAYGDSSIDAKGNKIGESDDRLLVQRLMFGLKYKQTADIQWNLIIYDARVYGWSLENDNFVKNRGTDEEYVMNPQEDFFELYNANVEIKNLFTSGLTATIGRQRIVYGDKRMIGPGSWGNSMGWMWDAAKFSYKFNGNFVDAFYGQTKDKDPDTFSMTRKHVYEGAAVYTHFTTTKKGAFEPFFVWKHSLRPAIKSGVENYEKTNHYGFRAYEKDFHGFNYDITYAKETGTNGAKDVDAYAYVLKGGYGFKDVVWKPKIVLGNLFASGDSNPTDGTIKSYTRPFGSTDGSHYGRMDIMFFSNLVDYQVNLHLDPMKEVHLKLSYHNFNMAESQDTWSYYKYKNKAGNTDTALGEEYDFQMKWKYNKQLELQAIYAYFKAGDFVKNNVEDNDAQRLFLQFTYKFNKIL